MTEAKKVLVVAVDFSPCGDEALLTGLSMAQHGQVETLHMVYVLDPRDLVGQPEKPLLLAEEEVVAGAPAKLLAWASSLAARENVSVEPARLRGHIRIGRVAPSLIQLCIDYDADLILVGTYARRGLERLRLGSVAETLVREAPCPVLIARPKDYSGRTKTALPDQPYGPGEAPINRGLVPFERTVSVSMDGWCASDDSPTGIRTV